jgi:hypothetical protein
MRQKDEGRGQNEKERYELRECENVAGYCLLARI